MINELMQNNFFVMFLFIVVIVFVYGFSKLLKLKNMNMAFKIFFAIIFFDDSDGLNVYLMSDKERDETFKKPKIEEINQIPLDNNFNNEEYRYNKETDEIEVYIDGKMV